MTPAETGMVVARGRLHFGLLDLRGDSGRRYGGSGVMLREPVTKVTWSQGHEPLTLGLDLVDRLIRHEVRAAVDRLADTTGRELIGSLAITCQPPSHHGYGSKTALLLGVLHAASRVNDLHISHTDLAVISGRGGASGVGIHGYEHGGMVVDSGHEPSARLGPSSYGPPRELPLLIAQHPFPDNWAIGLIDLPGASVLTRDDEMALFQEGSQLQSMSEVATSISAVYHRLLSGVLISDLSMFRQGLEVLQHTGFKRLEIEAQSPAVKDLLNELETLESAASGMSSLGPLVFAICQADDRDSIETINRIALNRGATARWTRAWNTRSGEYGVRNGG